MKDIEKYVGYYLLVYVVVLALCGFIQYLYKCQGQSLVCAVSSDGLVNILTVTAYVITPIVAIIGFANWKAQNHHNKIQEILISLHKKTLTIRTNIVRLKMDKSLNYPENYYELKLSDFKLKINDLRISYKLKIDKIRSEYDELNNELSLLDFYGDKNIKNEFEPILDKYFRLIERLDNAYIEYTEFHLKFKEFKLPYVDDYFYRACRSQICLVWNTNLKAGNGESPLLGSAEDLSNLKTQIDTALQTLRKLKY